MVDITQYMGRSILAMLKDARSFAGLNPGTLLFLTRFLKASRKAFSKRSSEEAKGGHIPPFLIASIADTCNLHCKGCYAVANHACMSGRPPLPAERWGEIFNEAQALGVSFILLAGGEPLTRPDVLEKAAMQKDIAFPVFTNGTLIDDKRVAFFIKHRNMIPVLSIEGGREQTDTRRGDGVYDRLCAVMRRLQRSRLFYAASVTVTKENLHEVTGDDFLSFLSKRGCSLIFYVEYVPADGKSMELAPDDNDREFLANEVMQIQKKYRMLTLSFPGDEKYLGGCLAAGRGFFHINAAGGAEPCPFSPYSDLSLRDHTLEEALSSELFQKLRADGVLSAGHSGGCVLFEQRETVQKMVE